MHHDYLLQFFTYKHLPPHLQAVSKPFGDLARVMVDTLPSNPERSAGLRLLLQAKDCAVRALLFKKVEVEAPPPGHSNEEWDAAVAKAYAAARERGETV
jgi:hypothetical protein